MTTPDNRPDPQAVRAFLLEWQKDLCARLEHLQQKLHPDAPPAPFRFDHWQRGADSGQADNSGRSTSDKLAGNDTHGTDSNRAHRGQAQSSLRGSGISAVTAGGPLWEKAGVNFSHVTGASLPPAASARHPHLAGRTFEAMGVSIVIHPLNPYIPTTHANIRFLSTTPAEEARDSGNAANAADAPLWWFGGGFDLTPYYGFSEDAAHWHKTAKTACDPFGTELYPKFKEWCDRYFYLPHRDEARGLGGLFFDDTTCDGNFDTAFALSRSIAKALFTAYAPIVERRAHTPYAERERNWQLYRRGRYVEFNLICDRGTHFGLQSRGRTESILMSLPPLVRWEYDYHPQAGSPEAELLDSFLPPRDWLAQD